MSNISPLGSTVGEARSQIRDLKFEISNFRIKSKYRKQQWPKEGVVVSLYWGGDRSFLR